MSRAVRGSCGCIRFLPSISRPISCVWREPQNAVLVRLLGTRGRYRNDVHPLRELSARSQGATQHWGLPQRSRDHAWGAQSRPRAPLQALSLLHEQLPIARSYLRESESAALEKLDPVVALDRLLGRLAEEGARNPQQLTEWFELLAADYPTETDNRRRRGGGRQLGEVAAEPGRQERAIDLLGGGRALAFETVALHLNFEDMARASNNVMEWQSYQTLARDSSYGFARGRGEELRYTCQTGS